MKKSEKVAVTVGAVIMVPTICLIGLILYTSVSGKEIKLDTAKFSRNAEAESGPEAGASVEDAESAALYDAAEDTGGTGEAPLYGAPGSIEDGEEEPSVIGIRSDMYEQLGLGMSYDEAAAIFGMEGTDITSGGIAGATVYQWFAADDSGNAMVAFLDGKAVGKARTGTAKQAASGQIDKAAYDQISAGMSYDEVTAALGGPGILLADSSALSSNSVLYVWLSPDGITNAVLAFADGKVSEKTQFGLE